MFGRHKVPLTPELYRKAEERAKALGFPSVEAYVARLVERDLEAVADEAQRERILRQMKGLGYLE